MLYLKSKSNLNYFVTNDLNRALNNKVNLYYRISSVFLLNNLNVIYETISKNNECFGERL